MNHRQVFVCLLPVFTVVYSQCKPDEFLCSNGGCIPGTWVCDRENDCGDMSDEQDQNGNCPACPQRTFACKTTGRCISLWYVCDKFDDCGDNSDEVDSETAKCPKCPGDAFTCSSGGCLYPSESCDGYDDCGDWSDESIEACPCTDNEIRCSGDPEENGPPPACIPPEFICDEDGIWDCPNGDDEANCSRFGGNLNPQNITRERTKLPAKKTKTVSIKKKIVKEYIPGKHR